MTDCIDREDCYTSLVENMQVIRQTEQYGEVCVLVFGGMDTPDFGSCMQA